MLFALYRGCSVSGGVVGTLLSGGLLSLPHSPEGPFNYKGLVVSQVEGPLHSPVVPAAQSRQTPFPTVARLQSFNRTEMD